MGTYARKSSFTRTNILASLSVDPIFNALSTSQKNQLIDEAVQKVAALRNSLGKEDYKFDSTTILDAITLTLADGQILGFKKHIYVIAISSGTTFNGVTYEADTVILQSYYGMGGVPATPTIAAGVMHVVTTDKFSTAVQVIPNNSYYLYSTVDPDDITFNLGTGWGVYSALIYEVDL